MNQNKSLVLILAAGRGTRMKSEVPKPLSLVYNKPIISWIIESFKKNNIDICLVINPIDKKKFENYHDDVRFVYQNNPKGTGHAVIQTIEIIKNYSNIFIFVGDSPFVGSNIISKMIKSHLYNNSDCTILSGIFNEKKISICKSYQKK